MKVIVFILVVIVLLMALVCCVALIKYLNFDRKIKEANQKQSKSQSISELFSDIHKWEKEEGNELQKKEWQNEKNINQPNLN